ncbi:MAG: hypothetical protein QXP01_03800, partial [Candidatus Hadarchaeum sp.]
VLINSIFVQKMEELGVDPHIVVRLIIARALNRYIRIPESFGQVLRMYKAMREQLLGEAETARRFLEIYFALWNEIDLYENRGFAKDLIEVYRASLQGPQKEALETYYLVLVGILQARWNVDLGLGSLEGWEHLARKLAEIDYLNGEDRERDAREFAKYFHRCCQVVEGVKKEEKDKEIPPHWPLENTVDLFTSAWDIREGLLDFIQAEGDEAFLVLAELTKMRQGLAAALSKVLLLETTRWIYYDQLAQKHRIPVKYIPVEPEAKLFNVSLRNWSPEDGVDNLAPLASFGPVGTPGLTKKWLRAGRESGLVRQSLPDLLTLIDSSGSMTNPHEQLSYAVLAGVVAAQTYLDHGSRVAVINFSSEDLILDFNSDRIKIIKYLVAYQAGGTSISPDSIARVLRKTCRPVDILLISDMAISNLDEVVATMTSYACSHRIFIFLIGRDPSELRGLRAKFPNSVEWHQVNNDQDLVQLVLGTVREGLENGGRL